MPLLHRFCIAIARNVVNHDGGGGTAPDTVVWSAVSPPKRRRTMQLVRDLAVLPGLGHILEFSVGWGSYA